MHAITEKYLDIFMYIHTYKQIYFSFGITFVGEDEAIGDSAT